MTRPHPPVDDDLGPYERSGPIRVLVAEDDARVRTAIRETLALEAGLLIAAEAADAETALALAAATSPSVALVDILLPDAGTGLALVRSMSRQPGCSVVAMSVRGGLRGAALEAGAVAFAEKGNDINALLHSIRAAADR